MLTKEHFAERLKQAHLASKNDIATVKKVLLKIPKIGKLQTYDLIFFLVKFTLAMKNHKNA